MDVAIVGLGGVGRLHLAAARQTACTLAGLVDPHVADLDQLAAASGTTAYRTLQDLLARARPGLAIIATPAATHADLVIACAAAGVNVLCEKPLAVTIAQAQRMTNACDRAGVHLIYGASYRYIPALFEAHRLIAAGAIGTVRTIRETLIGGAGTGSHVPMGPAHYPVGGPGGSGFGLVDHGVHLIDAFAWLCGAELTSVFGRGNIVGAEPRPEFLLASMSTGAAGLLVYDDDTFSTDLPQEGYFGMGAGWDFDGTFIPAGGWTAHPHVIHVHGSLGALRIHHYGHALFLRDANGIRQIPLPEAPPPAHFAAQLAAAIAAAGGAPVEVPGGRQGLAALAALLATYRSASTGAAVDPRSLLQG
jgi:predicted dehydrogenase